MKKLCNLLFSCIALTIVMLSIAIPVWVIYLIVSALIKYLNS